MNRIALCVLVACASVADARQGAGADRPGAPDVLAGPRVAEAPARPTLVEFEYGGAVKRTQVAPEEAAVRLLALSPEEDEAVGAVLTERSRLMEDFVTDHLDLLLRLGAASESGDKRAQLAAVVEAFQAVKPIREKGPLAGQVRAVLGPSNRARFNAILKEYWDAIVAERRATAEKAGTREGRLGIIADERFKSFGREIERAFTRIVDPQGEREFNELLAALELRPEQEQRIRRMAEEFIVRARFRPTQKQEQAFIVRVASLLDEKQRRLLAERIAAEERERAMGGTPMGGK